jgi:acid stress-induced BolA-like protein IbaG/YrbA
MAKLTKSKLESILSKRLSLKNPQYFLEGVDGRLVGHVVSSTFRRKRPYRRQEMIWDALEAEFGPKAARLVGMLLAYTPGEWDPNADDEATPTKRKKVG